MQNSNSIPCKIGIVGPPSAKQCVTTGKSMQCKKALETIQNFPPDSQISQCINKHNSKYVSLLSSKSTMQCCDNQGLITVSPANEWTGYELTPSRRPPNRAQNAPISNPRLSKPQMPRCASADSTNIISHLTAMRPSNKSKK